MGTARAFAERKDSIGGGFDYLLPNGCNRAVLRYFEALAELFLSVWVYEIDLLVLNRATADLHSDVTARDIDVAFSNVLNAARFTNRPRLVRLARRNGLPYRAPTSCPDQVLAYFERSAQLFLNLWSSEIEQVGYTFPDAHGEPTMNRKTIERAVNIAVSKTLSRRETLTVPGEEDDGQAGEVRHWIWKWYAGVMVPIGGLVIAAHAVVSAAAGRPVLLCGLLIELTGITAAAVATYGRRD